MKRKQIVVENQKEDVIEKKTSKRQKMKGGDDFMTDLVNKTVKLWEKARVIDIPKSKRDELIANLMDMVKGHLGSLVLKRGCSRVVQTLLKYGNQQQKEEIFVELIDKVVDFSREEYGHFVVKKMLKKADRKWKEKIFNKFRGKFVKMSRNRISSSVVEYIFDEICKPAEKQLVLEEFYGPQMILVEAELRGKPLGQILNALVPEKKKSILNNLFENVTKMLNKAEDLGDSVLMHHLLWDFCKNTDVKGIRNLLPHLRDHLVRIIHTKKGALVGVLCVGCGTAKDRKIILKSLLSYEVALASDEYAHFVLCRLVDVVDDTVTMGKHLLRPLVKENVLHKVLANKYAILVLLHILCPRNPRIFTPTHVMMMQPDVLAGQIDLANFKDKKIKNENENENENDVDEGKKNLASKKAWDIRRAEMMTIIQKPLVEHVCGATCDISGVFKCRLRSVLLLEIVKYLSFEKEKDEKGKGKLLHELLSKMFDCLISDFENGAHLFQHPIAHRAIKLLIIENPHYLEDSFSNALALKFENHIGNLLNKSRVTFVTMALLGSVDQKLRARLLKRIKLIELDQSIVGNAQLQKIILDD